MVYFSSQKKMVNYSNPLITEQSMGLSLLEDPTRGRKRQLRLNPVNEALYLKRIVKAIYTRWRHGMLETILSKPREDKLDQHVIFSLS